MLFLGIDILPNSSIRFLSNEVISSPQSRKPPDSSLQGVSLCVPHHSLHWMLFLPLL